MDKYSLIIEWSEEDKVYVATCPEFQGLSAHGKNRSEASKNAESALQLFIEDMRDDGEPLPLPQLRRNKYSGQIRFRMPQTLHASLVLNADREGMSLNSYILYLISSQSGADSILKKAASINQMQIGEAVQEIKEHVTSQTMKYEEDESENKEVSLQ